MKLNVLLYEKNIPKVCACVHGKVYTYKTLKIENVSTGSFRTRIGGCVSGFKIVCRELLFLSDQEVVEKGLEFLLLCFAFVYAHAFAYMYMCVCTC